MLRRLRDVIGKYWEKNTAPHLRAEVPPLSDEERLWNQLIAAGGCVDCTKTPKGFYEGPSGGVSTNVFCSQCGQGYNLTPIAHFAERIHKDKKYIRPITKGDQ